MTRSADPNSPSPVVEGLAEATKRPARVLLVEDSPAQAALVCQVLEEEGGFQVRWVDRLSAAEQAWRNGGLEAIVLDLALPDSQGLHTVERMRAAAPGAPILVLSETLDEREAVHVLRAGAEDYLLKDRHGVQLLPRALRYAIERRQARQTLRAGEGLERLVAVRTAELRDREARLRGILDTAPDGILTIDERGLIESVNPACEKLFGYSAAEMIGRPVKTLMRAADTAGAFAGLLREVVGRRQDGSEFPVELAVSGFSMGVRRLFTALARDISERKRIEDELAESELRFRQLAEHISDAFWMVSADARRILYVSPAYEQLWGRSCSSLYEKPEDRLEAIHAEDRERVAKAFLEGAANGNFDEEYRVVRPDSSVRWVRDQAYPVRDASGEVHRIVGVARDITERRRAEQRLREAEGRRAREQSEEFYHLLVERVTEYAILRLDPEGRVASWNLGAERIVGYRAEEIVGRHFSCFYLPEDLALDKPGQLLERAVAEGLVEDEGWRRRRDGTRFWANIVLTALREDGHLRGFANVTRDLSERRRNDEARAQAKLKLSEYSQQVQGQNRRLRIQNLMLTQANQELDEFAYVVSHDLKEPLRGLHNYAGFLLEDYREHLDEPGRAKLEALTRLAARMEQLINAVLEYSRLGRSKLAHSNTDLTGVVSDVLASLKFFLEENGVQARVPRPLPSIHCDRVRIGEVFQNLIINAAKYNDKAEKWIEIGHGVDRRRDLQPSPDSVEARGRPSLVLYVKDNGIGIREQHREAIFRMFKRLHGRDQHGGGTGVGLTIVRKIVERHGGRVWVDSVFGEGSTFYFALPQGETGARAQSDDSDG